MQTLTVKDANAAMSLCVLSNGRGKNHHLVSPTPMDMDYPSVLPSEETTISLPNVIIEEESTSISMKLTHDFQAVVAINPSRVLNYSNCSTKALSLQPKKKRLSRGKYVKKFYPVSIKEMKRLMHVYGPIKCSRNRKSLCNHQKDTSVKRKFYRWFEDFNERFEMTENGRFIPKYGHEYEMKYREDMRKKDQQVLTKKRCAKRCGIKASEVEGVQL